MVKIDVMVKDALGAWQLTTIQRFYSTRKLRHEVHERGGQRRTSAVLRRNFGIGRSILGILIEHYAGAFHSSHWFRPWLFHLQDQNVYAEKYFLY